MSVSRALYLMAGLVAPPLALPFFAAHPRGRRRLGERCGGWGLSGEDLLWFHGASVGEVAGLLPLIRLRRERFPADKILLSALSASGLDRSGSAADFTRILPFDHPLWLGRALRGVRVRGLVFGETEIWPALLDRLSRRGVPLMLVNGRMSEFSLGAYRLARPWIRPALAKIDLICAANRKYRERFI